MKILFTNGLTQKERQTEVQGCIFHILKLKKANYSHISIFMSKELKVCDRQKIQNVWHQASKDDFTLERTFCNRNNAKESAEVIAINKNISLMYIIVTEASPDTRPIEQQRYH
uniref:Uncharacterized protein n=1 Tax=Glossina pallidipes TaxID=7398 RepID=A0A1A9ZBK1_GLOPL